MEGVLAGGGPEAGLSSQKAGWALRTCLPPSTSPEVSPWQHRMSLCPLKVPQEARPLPQALFIHKLPTAGLLPHALVQHGCQRHAWTLVKGPKNVYELGFGLAIIATGEVITPLSHSQETSKNVPVLTSVTHLELVRHSPENALPIAAAVGGSLHGVSETSDNCEAS